MGNDATVNLGFVEFSDKGVKAKPQFKVGYHDEDGGFGGGFNFEKGIKADYEAKAKIDGKQWGGGGGGGVEINDGLKFDAKQDLKVHGYNVAESEAKANVQIRDGNLLAGANAEAGSGSKNVKAGANAYVGKDGIGGDIGASAGVKTKMFNVASLSAWKDEMVNLIDGVAGILIKEFGNDILEKIAKGLTEIVDTICKALCLTKLSKLNENAIRAQFRVSVGIGGGGGEKHGLKDDDGYIMYGAGLSMKIAEVGVSHSLFIGYHNKEGKIKVEGNLYAVSWKMIISDSKSRNVVESIANAKLDKIIEEALEAIKNI